jgi:carbon monoxide dehydrogenase subunit G
MQFSGEREVRAPIDRVWTGLNDPVVLRSAIPGCQGLTPTYAGIYSATLAVRVGPIADTYRGIFTIEELCPGTGLQVSIEGRGRAGRLDIDLSVGLEEGLASGTTLLTYDAQAGVRGLVARLGSATLSMVGAHLTGCFFRDLDRSLIASRPRTSRTAAHA